MAGKRNAERRKVLVSLWRRCPYGAGSDGPAIMSETARVELRKLDNRKTREECFSSTLVSAARHRPFGREHQANNAARLCGAAALLSKHLRLLHVMQGTEWCLTRRAARHRAAGQGASLVQPGALPDTSSPLSRHRHRSRTT